MPSLTRDCGDCNETLMVFELQENMKQLGGANAILANRDGAFPPLRFSFWI
jgi:hypothetical protein